MKYQYIGAEPALLTDHHIEVEPGAIVESETPINSALFVPVDDKKKTKGDDVI